MKINRKGLIGTLIVHILVLLLLIIGGLTFPEPPPEEEGILVNFGTDDTGFGESEPAGSGVEQSTPEPEEVVVQEQPQAVEEIVADNTQDVEQVKVREDPQPDAEELKRQREEEQRIQRQREEEERIRQEKEAERLRQEEEQKKREEQANRLNNLGRNTFGNTGTGESTGSEGVNPGDGNNQGVETGSPGASNYGNGSGLGNGPSYGLGTRKAVGQLPLPNVNDCNVTSRIVVTVEIKVDREGNVVGASVSSATFADNCIWKVVVEAAKKTKFTGDQNAALKQTGWIRYTIEP